MIRPQVSEQPRVLFCCFDVVPGPHAQSRRLTEYIKGLGDRFQVVVLSVKTTDNSHIQRYHGARLLRVPVGSGDLPARVQAFDRAVRRQLESEEYLLVHFFDPFGGYALSERRAEFGYRVIYDASTFASIDMPLASAGLAADRKFIARIRRQELFCLMNADCVVVGGEVGRGYVTNLGVPSDRVTLLRPPVDLAPYSPDVMGRPDGQPMRLLHLGSENPWAGLQTLIHALATLPPTDVHLTVVGPNHPEEHVKLIELVASLRLEQMVDFQEPVAHDDLHKVLAASDVGLLTMSDVERNRAPGGALARLGEYLAAGRPVIAADLPLARELVPADAAIFYEPDNSISLAQALTSLAADPPRRLMMGASARKAALRWDASSVRGALLDVYSAVAGPIVSSSSSQDDLSRVPTPVRMHTVDAVTQLGARPSADDPSTPVQYVKADTMTDPHSAGTPPQVMGRLLRDEAPVVVGEMMPSTPDEHADFARAAVTDLEGPSQQVVMGLPVWLNEPAPGPAPTVPFGRSMQGSQAPPPPQPVFIPPLDEADLTESPSSVIVDERLLGGWSQPSIQPAPRSVALATQPTPRPARSPQHPEGAPLIVSKPSGVRSPSPIAASAGVRANALAGFPLPPISAPARRSVSHAPPPLPRSLRDEAVEVGNDEVFEVDAGDHPSNGEAMKAPPLSVAPTGDEISLPSSALDPWLAQLVYGYCPPESQVFARHVPPTTMPGRD